MNSVIGKVAKARYISRLWAFPLTKRIPKALMPKEDAESGRIMIKPKQVSEDIRKCSHNYKCSCQRCNNKGGWKNTIPKGNLAVYVGLYLKRYVIPTSYLRMQELRVVMDHMAEEYGHYQKEGGLRIPICEEQEFEDILASCKRRKQIMSKTKKGKYKRHYSSVNL